MSVYEARATRSGAWWSVEISGAGPYPIFTQGRTLEDAEFMARDAVAGVRNVDASTVAISLTVPGAGDSVAAVAAARRERERERAAYQEQEVLARASADRVAQGISQRDAARLLGLSHQRVHQLLHRNADRKAA